MIQKKNINLNEIIWKIHIHKGEALFQSVTRTYIFKNNKLKLLEAPAGFQFSFQVDNHFYFQDVTKGILEYKSGKLFQLKN
jgi:hypothetical protein